MFQLRTSAVKTVPWQLQQVLSKINVMSHLKSRLMVSIICQNLQHMWHLRVFVLSMCHKAGANLLAVEREDCKDGEYDHYNLFQSFQCVPYKFVSERGTWDLSYFCWWRGSVESLFFSLGLYLLTLNSSPTHLYLVFSSLLPHKILHPAPPEPPTPLFLSPSASVNANTLLTMVTTRRNPVCAKTAPYHHQDTQKHSARGRA